MEVESLYNDRRFLLMVVLFALMISINDLPVGLSGASKLRMSSIDAAEQNCMLLVGTLVVLLKTLHVALPVFLSVPEFANRSMRSHYQL